MSELFSVEWWDEGDSYHNELTNAGPKTAVDRARGLIYSPAAKVGTIKRLIIKDVQTIRRLIGKMLRLSLREAYVL